jgi:hypothetical protein
MGVPIPARKNSVAMQARTSKLIPRRPRADGGRIGVVVDQVMIVGRSVAQRDDEPPAVAQDQRGHEAM